MIALIVGIVLALPAIPIYRTDRRRQESGYWGGSSFLGLWVGIFAFLFLFGGAVIPTTVAYVNQVSDRAAIVQFQSTRTIYESRATDLTKRFTRVLAVQYPAFEKKIFAELGAKAVQPESIEAYLAAYPQIRTSETLSKLVDEIRSLRDQIYAQDRNIVQAAKDMYVRRHNPWYLTFLLPSK